MFCIILKGRFSEVVRHINYFIKDNIMNLIDKIIIFIQIRPDRQVLKLVRKSK